MHLETKEVSDKVIEGFEPVPERLSDAAKQVLDGFTRVTATRATQGGRDLITWAKHELKTKKHKKAKRKQKKQSKRKNRSKK